MKIQLVQMTETGWQVQNIETTDPLAAMEVRGFTFVKLTDRPKLRAELQGQPVFAELLGPMWGGEENGEPVIRYENQAAYDRLSA